MTNKITKEFLFTELSIQIAVLDAKLDKLIELATSPTVAINRYVDALERVNIYDKLDELFMAAQFPVSDNENFDEEFK